MATALEIRKVLMVLATQYPYWEREMDETRLSAAYGLYERLLADIPGEVLEAAALAHVSESRFFPVIAELRAQAVAIQMPRRQSALEAFYDRNDPITRYVKSMLPDYNDRAITLREQSIIKAQFIKAYEQIVQEEREEMQLLPEVRELRDRLQLESQPPAVLKIAGGKG